MTLRSQLERAAASLINLRNADGGIPAVKLDHGSGCWTTADVIVPILEAGLILSAGIRGATEVVGFILNHQILDVGQEEGSWPLAQGARGSAMTTGHCCLALALASRVFDSDPALRDRIEQARRRGMQWLRQRQNSDGGWGTEPSSGGEGKRSTVLATAYAILPFFDDGETVGTPGTVRAAANFLRTQRNSGGSWSSQPSLPGDACSTARAAVALLRSGSCKPGDPLMKDALRFVLQARNSTSGLWDVAEEPFFYSDAGGYISFHRVGPGPAWLAGCWRSSGEAAQHLVDRGPTDRALRRLRGRVRSRGPGVGVR